jgi:MraZ protein
MFLGEYEHTLDDKNRLTLPAKFRERMAAGLVLTQGFEGRCLYAFSREDWREVIEQRVGSLDLLAPEGRAMRRFFFAGAGEADIDKQGRILVPAHLLERAELGRDVVVAGVYDHLEIWDRSAWRDQLKQVEGSAEHVAERLANRV